MTHNRRGVRQWGGGGGGRGFLTTAYFADNGPLLQAALRALDETQLAEYDVLSGLPEIRTAVQNKNAGDVYLRIS